MNNMNNIEDFHHQVFHSMLLGLWQWRMEDGQMEFIDGSSLNRRTRTTTSKR